MPKDFTDCTVLIYDEDDNLITDTKILEFDKISLSIEVSNLPVLEVGKICKLLILGKDVPYSYTGRINKYSFTFNKTINLYDEHEAEKRKAKRYKVSIPADVSSLVYDNKEYMMHTPINVRITSLSKSGLRLRSVPNAFSINNRIPVNIHFNGNDKLMIADVVYIIEISKDCCEYGCRLVPWGGELYKHK